MVYIHVDTRQCPICGRQIDREVNTGPGRWYWCDYCGDFTIHPDPKFIHQIDRDRYKEV